MQWFQAKVCLLLDEVSEYGTHTHDRIHVASRLFLFPAGGCKTQHDWTPHPHPAGKSSA